MVVLEGAEGSYERGTPVRAGHVGIMEGISLQNNSREDSTGDLSSKPRWRRTRDGEEQILTMYTVLSHGVHVDHVGERKRSRE